MSNEGLPPKINIKDVHDILKDKTQQTDDRLLREAVGEVINEMRKAIKETKDPEKGKELKSVLSALEEDVEKALRLMREMGIPHEVHEPEEEK